MRLAVVLPVIAAGALLAGLIAAFAPFTLIDGYADDAAAAARVAVVGSRDMGDAAVAVVLLDQESLARPPLTETPRALMSPIWAALAGKAFAHGADKVALDFILAYDAADLRVGETRPLKSYDAAFLRLLLREGRAGRLVIGRSRELAPARRFAAVAGAGVAHVDIVSDGDGVTRRMRLGFAEPGGGVAPTLAGALLGAASAEAVPITPPAPLTDLPTARAIDVLTCADAAALGRFFRGRTVLIGAGLPGEDRLRAPDRFMRRAAVPARSEDPCALAPPALDIGPGGIPGVLLFAGAVDAARSGWALATAPPLAVALAAAIVGAIVAFAGLGLAPASAAAVAAAVATLGFAGAAAAQEASVLFPAARLGFAALIGFAVGWSGRLVFLDRRARALRAGFGRYVSPELVSRLMAQDRLPELDGEQRHVAVMFADLSGFTALSERVDGKTLTATVNAYLTVIADEVARSGGYVDKFIGDAVMAIWNAPADHDDHERAAVQAAVAIRDAVAAAAARDAAAGLPTFSIKIGVNSGLAVVGNVGSPDRLNYTAVGDTVNVAARMEGLPSVLATPVVIGADCACAAAADFAMLEVASIQVKGRREPVAVFAPLNAADRTWFADYAAALAAYRARDFAAAAARWRALAAAPWNGASLAAAMAGLAEDTAREPLDDDWPGALVMRTK